MNKKREGGGGGGNKSWLSERWRSSMNRGGRPKNKTGEYGDMSNTQVSISHCKILTFY